MKYMLMFWVDEPAEVTANRDAAIMLAVTGLDAAIRVGAGHLRRFRGPRLMSIPSAGICRRDDRHKRRAA